MLSRVQDVDLRRAMGTREYRSFTTQKDRLSHLLFDLGLQRSSVAEQFGLSRDQVKRFVLSKGAVRDVRGRPKELDPSEEKTVKLEIEKRHKEMKSATAAEFIDIVLLYILLL